MDKDAETLMALQVLNGRGKQREKALDYFASQGMTEQNVLDSYWRQSKGTLDSYLLAHGTTRYQVAKQTGIKPNTLQRAADHDVADLRVKVISAVAQVVGDTPGQVLDELIKDEKDDAALSSALAKQMKEDGIAEWTGDDEPSKDVSDE